MPGPTLSIYVAGRAVAAGLCLFALLPTAGGAEAVTFGGRAAPGTVGDVYWNRFAEQVEAHSNGRVSVRLMIRGEVGPEEAIFAQLRRGRRIQLAGVSTSPMTVILPELDVLRLPFLFDSIEEVGYVLDEHLKAPVARRLLEHDLVMLDWMSAGWLNFYASFPIMRPEDAAGRRMRVNASDVAIRFLEAIDADIVPISFADVVPALQTGLIDGGEQSTQLFITGGIGKFAPHFSRTRHAFLTALIIANRAWYEALSEEDQRIYREAVPSDRWYRNLFTAGNRKALKQAVADGLIVHELSPEDRTVWREHTAKMRSDFIEKTNAGSLYQVILEGKAAFEALKH